ncbi:hypothetical protein ED312_08785 [Sinomicrobium pectinilyticum]|uniref:Uncharacterized protein n=1 Tax=Sinomicrobium pectinilyticum TaxID=1084421 RepID=A0A3N0EL80_SINP1|nr:hypothetical protein [Sinomicrobium pectinilyticum]RNL88532.1 hypothetical protein ED312_08785 [Sinomicrobium pectinilyticum]
MTEAIFGLIGVLVGSAISWFQTYWTNMQATKRNAKYLAIRVVCILDKFVEDCADVIGDDGLSFGQRTPEGYLEPQVKIPGAPIFPEDVDWKSIEHELMYKILSLPSDIEGADRIIKSAESIADPPDFEDLFNERKFWYSQWGVAAYKLSEELSIKYGIKKKSYNDWNPVEKLKMELDAVTKRRQKRIQKHIHFVKQIGLK